MVEESEGSSRKVVERFQKLYEHVLHDFPDAKQAGGIGREYTKWFMVSYS